MTFWGHLEDLRKSIIRMVITMITVTAMLFFFKNFLFDNFILAPAHNSFYLYKILGLDISLSLTNIDISAQFIIHMKATIICAFFLTFPYLIYEIWIFIAPALYENEKKVIRGAFMFAGGLFYLGLAIGYFIIFPLMINFFSGYHVSADIPNNFSLSSYISLFTSTVLTFGIVFQFPTVIIILSHLDIVSKELLRTYRRHAVCIVVILAALITPSGDVFSLLICSIPLYLLYEFSIVFCRSDADLCECGQEGNYKKPNRL